MTVEQERHLLEILRAPSPLESENGISVQRIAEQLSEHLPVVIDKVALEELGLSTETKLLDRVLMESPAVSSASGDASEDRWWDRTSAPPSAAPRLTLLGDLALRLDSSDLEIVLLHGRVVITTSEHAAEMNTVRMYEVSPLIDPSTDPVRPDGHGYRANRYQGIGDPGALSEYDRLIQTIQETLDPDCWEFLGGESTIRPINIRDRHWLVVSTPTMTQLKVQALLDRLNQ
ncbi:hypothetical protein FYK55_00395 [Roseiconus nitratireducens]|uniref:Uncharacterized protein n=2 Tax=Roseiconus nitratireducens TaxID=2605748 RepID=A0A5M6DL90_9BACT|nr:hypothetical protein FYK55_00395 [Roseiconus nitratireducens]